MAEKATGKDGARAPKAAPKGHNLEDLRKKLAPFVKDITAAYDEMEEAHGSFTLSIGHKFEKAAESTGFPKKLLRKEIARIRRLQKQEESEKAMADEEREETERFRAAMAGTAFGDWAAGELAKP